MLTIREQQESKREISDTIILIKSRMENMEQSIELSVEMKQMFYDVYELIDDLDRSLESFANLVIAN